MSRQISSPQGLAVESAHGIVGWEYFKTRAPDARETFWLLGPGAHMCISKAPQTFGPVDPFLVSKNGEAYAPEASCMKKTYVHIKNT